MRSLKEQLSHKRHVVWDWNGTLLDDVDLVIEIMSRILVEHSISPVTTEQYREVFCFPVMEYYRKLGFDFEKTPFHVVSDRFIDDYKREVLRCGLHDGAVTLLEDLKKAGVAQSVLSAAHEEHLKEILAHHGILALFDRVYGLADTHAKGKVERGRQLLEESGFTAEDSILVGDTDHDLEVGKALGMDVLLLGDGHQSYERLTRLHDNVVKQR